MLCTFSGSDHPISTYTQYIPHMYCNVACIYLSFMHALTHLIAKKKCDQQLYLQHNNESTILCMFVICFVFTCQISVLSWPLLVSMLSFNCLNIAFRRLTIQSSMINFIYNRNAAKSFMVSDSSIPKLGLPMSLAEKLQRKFVNSS